MNAARITGTEAYPAEPMARASFTTLGLHLDVATYTVAASDYAHEEYSWVKTGTEQNNGWNYIDRDFDSRASRGAPKVVA